MHGEGRHLQPKETPVQNINLTGILVMDFSFHNQEERDAGCLSHLVYGILLWQSVLMHWAVIKKYVTCRQQKVLTVLDTRKSYIKI